MNDKLLGEKFKIGHLLTIDWLQKAYELYGLAHIATDGIYVQIEKEPTSRQTK